MNNLPGIIILPQKIVKTTNVHKWISKNNPEEYTIKYLDPIPEDFRQVEKSLQEMVDKEQGIVRKEKQIFQEQRPYTHTYRVNVNTVLCAYSQEDLEKLKQKYIK